MIRSVLAGQPGPALNVVLANAAAALVAVGRVGGLREGVALAQEVIRDGRAARILERLIV